MSSTFPFKVHAQTSMKKGSLVAMHTVMTGGSPRTLESHSPHFLPRPLPSGLKRIVSVTDRLTYIRTVPSKDSTLCKM